MKTCENCGNEHVGEYGSGRFCSTKCSRGFSTKEKRKEINIKLSKFYEDKKPELIQKICQYKDCGKTYTINYTKAKSSKFCSRSCAAKGISIETRLAISNKMKGVNSGEKNGMYGKSPKNTQRILVYSLKHIGNTEFFVRSSYERDFVKEINENENIISFEYEPKIYKCKYVLDSKNRTHQPDFLINEKISEYVVEVKDEWTMGLDETKAKEQSFKENFNIDYRYWTLKNKWW